MAFELPPLAYDYAALEPYIDTQTMHLHHDKHHATYVQKLNDALAKHPELPLDSIEALLKDLDAVPEDIRMVIRNNGGGHANHTMFWEIMAPGAGGEPTGDVLAAINAAFGSFADFKTQFQTAGANRFGSGWVWLVRKSDGGLEIMSTPNQDNPISQGLWPILGNDIWEHSYYLKYQNRRPEYLEAWWNVVNWGAVAARFAA
jgi:Fe-Mn family superoxide dismutase